MKLKIILLFLCITTFHLAQSQNITEWEGRMEDGILYARNGANLLINDQSFSVVAGNQWRDYSYLGEQISSRNIATGLDYPFFSSRTAEGLLTAQKFVSGGNANSVDIRFDYFDGSFFVQSFPDELGNTPLKGPAGIQTAPYEYAIFGREFFRGMTVDPLAQEVVLDWEVFNDRGLGVDADIIPAGFAVCALRDATSSLLLLDNSGNLVSEIDYGDTLVLTVQTLSDGLILGGIADDRAFLQKTDLDGNSIWYQSYPSDSIAYEVTQTADGGFVYSGTTPDEELIVTKTDAMGSVEWRTVLPDGTIGHTIRERPYGGYVTAGRTEGAGAIFLASLSPAGEVGEQTDLEGQVSLDVNQIRTTGLFPNDFLFDGTYQFPADSSTNTIFTSGLWAGGVDPQNDLHLMAQLYTNEDIEPGFMGATEGVFNRTWSIDKEQIQRLKDDQTDGSLNQAHSWFLLTWPGKGNPNLVINGEPVIIDRDLAPFTDVNSDGVYNIYDGDYPLIKGDKMLWWVFHDDTEHLASGGLPLEIEVQCSLYAYGCTTDTPISQTTFLEYQITAAGNEPLENTKAGLFTDFDLGCYTDDYIGSIPGLDACYVYNSTPVDDPNVGGCTPFPTGEIPVQSLAVLSHPLSACMYFNNSSFSPPPGTTDPQSAAEFYNFLNGNWRDGTPLTQGGNGYDPASTEVVDFVFPDDPADVNGWSECNENLTNQDKRMLPSIDLGTLEPGTRETIKIAFITHSPLPLPCPAIEPVKDEISVVKQFNDAGWLDLSNEIWPEDTLLLTQGSAVLSLPVGGSYAWSDGHSGNSLEVTSPGWYSVEATAPWGCSWSDSVYVELVVSATESTPTPPIQVFPNPASHELTIRAEGLQLEKARFFDGTGRLQFVHDFSVGQRIKLDHVPAGVSFLEVSTSEGVFWEKVLVQKR